MMAAVSAAQNGNKVTLIEQNEKVGKKLFLTGKGRCNLTNACPVEELFDNIVTNKKFMYSSFYDLDNAATVSFFNECRLATVVERGNRVFPASGHSSDVIKALAKKMESLGVAIMLNTSVIDLATEDDKQRISGVIIKTGGGKRKLDADAVIMATGGCSYPTTGSDGRSFKMLEKLGIGIVPAEPSLVPFECDDPLIVSMQGLSLKNVAISVKVAGKNVYSGFGEMLFTHFGLSGPLILTASAALREKDYEKGVKVFINLKPALSEPELDRRIIKDFEEGRNRNFANSLGKLLPSKLIPTVIKKSGIDPEKKVNAITKPERAGLVKVLKCLEIDVSGNRGFNEAVITRGGVDVRQIDPSTMECKKIKGLYFAGEMIDVDALTGGFNLQIAWSTGYKAGSVPM